MLYETDLFDTNLPDWEQDDRFFIGVLDALIDWWRGIRTDWSTFDVVLIRTTWDYVDRRCSAQRLKEIAFKRFHSINRDCRVDAEDLPQDLEDSGISIAPTVWLTLGWSGKLMTAKGGIEDFSSSHGACAGRHKTLYSWKLTFSIGWRTHCQRGEDDL